MKSEFKNKSKHNVKCRKFQMKKYIWIQILNNNAEMSKQFTNKKAHFVKTRLLKSKFQKPMYKWK